MCMSMWCVWFSCSERNHVSCTVVDRCLCLYVCICILHVYLWFVGSLSALLCVYMCWVCCLYIVVCLYVVCVSMYVRCGIYCCMLVCGWCPDPSSRYVNSRICLSSMSLSPWTHYVAEGDLEPWSYLHLPSTGFIKHVPSTIPGRFCAWDWT